MARTSRKNPVATVAKPEKIEIFQTAIYLRLSLEDNQKKDADSLANQQALLMKYVEARPFLQLAGIYTDNGCTGTDFDRPQFKRMMEDARSGKINCIVVKDLSRLGRNYVEAGDYLEKVFPFLGIRFIAVNDNYDSNNINSSDQLVASLKNLVNDAYAKDLSRKISTAMQEKRRRGDFVGAYEPYGYRRDPNNTSKLIIDPEIAPIVEEIFELRATGIGIEKICRVLNEKGYPSPGRLRFERGIITHNNRKGSELPWNRHVLTDLLRNVVYIGNLAQGRVGVSLYQGIPYHQKDKSEWDVVTGTHEPIISMELWDQVQSLNTKRSNEAKASFGKNANLPKRQNPYGSLLRCADCGRVIKQVRSYRKSGNKDYYTYKCPQYIELGAQACTFRRMTAEALDQAVLETMRRQMDVFLEIQTLLRQLMADNSTANEPDAQRKQQIRAELEQKRNVSASLYADYKDGTVSQEEYVYAKEKLRADIEALDQELYELQYTEKRTADVIIGEKKWSELIERYYRAESVTAEMVTAMIKEIRLHSDSTITIKFLYEDEFKALLSDCEAVRAEVA
ncbi:MAG: recombinase family protein [Oscillospiraceae bacterium]|nr:recombinase family protein [Oscillospiraceae bacterium]